MKNKLLKFLTCFAGISAIGSTITITSASCGCSAEKINPLPDEVYEIDDNNVLQGFKTDFLNNPDSEIYQDNFKDCNAMKIPVNITSIGYQAFFNRTYNDTTIPEYIKKVTFAKGSMLTSLNGMNCFDHSGFTSIDFSNCNNLTSLNGISCFDGSKLTSVKFPKNLKEIGDFVFSTCASLTSVTFPSSLTSIGDCAFLFCFKLTSITFPRSLTTIGKSAFDCCTNLSSITWNAWNGEAYLGADSFDEVVETGTVSITNPVKGHSSTELLQYLKDNCGLPEGWITKQSN